MVTVRHNARHTAFPPRADSQHRRYMSPRPLPTPAFAAPARCRLRLFSLPDDAADMRHSVKSARQGCERIDAQRLSTTLFSAMSRYGIAVLLRPSARQVRKSGRRGMM